MTITTLFQQSHYRTTADLTDLCALMNTYHPLHPT